MHPPPGRRSERLGAAALDDVVDVLADAFSGYPVMRFVLGHDGNTPERLSTLIGLFVFRRLHLGGPMFGVRDSRGHLVGAAVMTLPREPEPSDQVIQKRDETWRVLGDDCRERHDAYGAIAKTVLISEPHHHLNMIGVRRSHQGQGLARPLLESAIGLAEADPDSVGLTLTTETESNVRLYQHFGFQVTRTARVADAFDTWGLFASRLAAGRPSL